jgi:alpha-2-macroglobulin
MTLFKFPFRAGIAVFIILFVFFSACSKRKNKDFLFTPAYNPEIAAFTSGLIPAETVIQVRLSADYSGEINTQEAIDIKLFDFSPAVAGKAFWLNNRTIEFRPDERFISGQQYKIIFRVPKLFPKKTNVHDFEFRFDVIPLDIVVEFTGLQTQSRTDLIWNEIKGRVLTTDKVDGKEIEKIVKAMQNGHNLSISWQHDRGSLSHEFSIDSIHRSEKREIITINWDAGSIKSNVKGSKEFEIPALNEFTLLETKIIQQPEQYIQLLFSDPIKTDQYLNGLISLSNSVDLRFTVDNNIIRVYPGVRQSGSLELTLEPGIKNILGYGYKEQKLIPVNFIELKPEVRLIGQGVIMPEAEGLIFPFEAVNLKAIEVKIIRIYEDNIAQFLQVNDLNGDYELKRAGRLIAKKTVNLVSNRSINYSEWNAFAIDLGEMIKAEPGAIYHVELGFQKKHSLYDCGDTISADNSNLTEIAGDENNISESELSYYDSQYGYYNYEDYDYQEDYDWDERDNPCSDSYYRYNRKVSRNILASNLGIIAKTGNDMSMLFAITDLLTTKPVGGVNLELYNFQQQLLATITTDNNGFAEMKLENQPFLLVAKKGQQRGYLKLSDGSSLSLSQFDVSGNEVNKGIKGFIYGERGVWRPGDSLYLNFILEDKDKVLPENHPVSFELYDARGKINKKVTLTEGLNGFYSFKAITNTDAPTGNWRLEVRVGGLSFSSRIRIETVKPNRLKIKLEFPDAELHADASKNLAKVNVSWLHGAPAGNLETRIAVNFSLMETVFKGFEEYIFSDPTKSFSPGEREIFKGKLNEKGETSFTPEFFVKGTSPGKLRATFISRCFEKGGDFSIDQFSIPFSPYNHYIGLKTPKGDQYEMLLTDTLQNFEIISLDEFGKPVDIEGLEVNVFKLDWRWWWHSSGENLASYAGSSYDKPVFQKITNTKEGKAKFSFKIAYPDWGRFLVRVNDPAGLHSSARIVYFDWPGEVSRSSRNDPQSASLLVLSTDKVKYNVGETAKITIPSGQSGRILLCIENGTKVINHFWLESEGKQTSFSLPITAEMSPNVYINVSLIQAHGQTQNDLPIRMYGVIPVFVENPQTHLEPEISMPDILRPDTEIEIGISEKNNKKMTYTVSIVDEGLLDITRFRTPDPWKNFYAREALGVKTYDIYDWVLGAYGGRIDGVFSIGGGEDVDGQAQVKANRFPPMVRAIGPFTLEEGKKSVHKIKIPNYIGSVKVMVIAGNSGAYGNTEKVCPVRKPLMILTTLPRVLGPGENVSIPVTVFAMEEQVKKVTIKLESNAFFDLEETEKTIEFNSTGDKTVDFIAQVKSKIGIGKFKITAKSGKEEASNEVELEVRSPNPEITELYYGVLNPGEVWEKQFNLPGIMGTNRADLEVSSLPPVDFGRRLKYLLDYPYGCMEQVTSAVFPQLYLSDVMETDQVFKNFTDQNIKAAIQKLQNFQLWSGGLGLWPNSTIENDWGTSYAGHFMLEAQKKGYSISKDWLKKWISYQKKIARSWIGDRYENKWDQKSMELSEAYRLYTLALAGEPELGAMNRLREKSNLDISARWQLAAAYALAGQQQTSIELVTNLTTEIPVYFDTYYTYGSELRDKGFILQTLTLLNKKEEAVPVMQYISEKLSSEGWYSTQTTAICLMAVSQYAGSGNTSKDLSFDFIFNGGEKKHAATNSSFTQIPIKFEKQESGKVSVSNTGKGIVFVRLSVHGTPSAGEEKSLMKNLNLQVNYKDLNGNPIDIKSLVQGTDFLAVVSIYNPGTYDFYQNLALTQIFPSGWEIQNQRLFESNIGNFDIAEYQDIRDDRVYTFFNLQRNETKKFAVKLNASYKGRFYLPGILCEEMYRGDVRAIAAGGWIEVK